MVTINNDFIFCDNIKLSIVLGAINSLMAINVRNNPLEYPPNHVIHGGIKQIKQHLLAILQAKQGLTTFQMRCFKYI